ncbi:MAG: hypothetical protein AB1813_01945 [Verrucomicrobiota bacterium]
MQGLIAQLQSTNGADRIDIFPDGPVARLEAHISSEDAGASERSSDSWELLGNMIGKKIQEHPKLLKYSAQTHGIIQSALKDCNDANTTGYSAVYQAATAAITQAALDDGLPNGDALNFFDLMLKGTDSYNVSQYVLRKTQVVSSRYTNQLAYLDVEKIWTPAQIVKAEAMPATIVFQIWDSQTQTEKIQPNTVIQSGYAWGWLKQSPVVSSVSRGKVEITQEWWLEAWSTDLYEQSTYA